MQKTLAERVEEAKAVLRVDGSDNDYIIMALCEAIPSYIETVTGYPEAEQDNEPLIETVSGFIVRLWYYADHAEDVKLQRTIDSLLKVITLKANALNRAAGTTTE